MTTRDLQRTNVPGLMKNSRTGVVINQNIDKFAVVKSSKIKSKEMKTIKADIRMLQKELFLMKELLKKHGITT